MRSNIKYKLQDDVYTYVSKESDKNVWSRTLVETSMIARRSVYPFISN